MGAFNDKALFFAERLQEIGADLTKVCRDLGRLADGAPASLVDVLNDVPGQGDLDTIAAALKAAGHRLQQDIQPEEACA
jgi:hypothetical protein